MKNYEFDTLNRRIENLQADFQKLAEQVQGTSQEGTANAATVTGKGRGSQADVIAALERRIAVLEKGAGIALPADEPDYEARSNPKVKTGSHAEGVASKPFSEQPAPRKDEPHVPGKKEEVKKEEVKKTDRTDK